MIKKLTVRNFKSLFATEVLFEPITVLIGRSGTGKSNLILSLRTLRELIATRDGFRSFSETGLGRTGPVHLAGTRAATSWSVEFTVPEVEGDFAYHLVAGFDETGVLGGILEEKLDHGGSTIFAWRDAKWDVFPDSKRPAAPTGDRAMIGFLKGDGAAQGAFRFLTAGIGCYSFPDNVLANASRPGSWLSGMADDGFGAMTLINGVRTNPKMPHIWTKIIATLREVAPYPKVIDELFAEGDMSISPAKKFSLPKFVPLSDQSEGFRRLLADMIAIYQNPSKPVMCFEEPEKGIYYDALYLLADHFCSANDKLGIQFILTTQSPHFLDRFPPDSIRMVEIGRDGTHVAPVDSARLLDLRHNLMTPAQLLTL